MEKIPASLCENGCFCTWRDKVPYNPKTGYKARPNDPATFVSYTDAVTAMEHQPDQYEGMGIGLFGDLVGIDIDHCIDESGEMSDLAKNIVDNVDSYAELSPSGTGVHILCRAGDLAYDSERYMMNNRSLGLEVYVAGETSRFLTLTGNRIHGTETEERSAEVQDVLDTYMLRAKESATEGGYYPEQTELRLSDNEVRRKMFCSKNGQLIMDLMDGEWADNGYSSQSEADLALCNYLAFFTGRNAEQIDRLFRTSGLYREKWDEMRGGMTYGQQTVSKAIAGCKSVYDPLYRSGITTEDDGVQQALTFLRERDAVRSARYSLDDAGAGYLLADYLKPFCRPTEKASVWMVYDGTRWRKEHSAAVAEEAAKLLGKAVGAYGAEISDDTLAAAYLKFAGRWRNHTARKMFIADASSVYQVKEDQFDVDHWLLNCNNGTLNLRTMIFTEHNPNDMLTRLAPVDYEPGARCERWEAFVGEIMEVADDGVKTPEQRVVEQEEKAEFLQRYLGYCLTGDTSSEAFMMLHGATSRNGKSVCVGTVQTILGDYAQSCAPETVTMQGGGSKDGRAPSENIARLKGIRLAVVAEIQQGTRLDASRVKTLTGGDVINARFLGENSFDFRPQCKLLMHTNHLPFCSDMSVFDSGRALVLRFERHFEDFEQDRGLKELFRQPESMSGILNWLLTGLAAWKKKGLVPPKAVRIATAEYRADGDKVQRFLEEETERDPKEWISMSRLYASYQNWCRRGGQYAERQTEFKQNVEKQGYSVSKKRILGLPNPMSCVIGLKLTCEWRAAG